MIWAEKRFLHQGGRQPGSRWEAPAWLGNLPAHNHLGWAFLSGRAGNVFAGCLSLSLRSSRKLPPGCRKAGFPERPRLSLGIIRQRLLRVKFRTGSRCLAARDRKSDPSKGDRRSLWCLCHLHAGSSFYPSFRKISQPCPSQFPTYLLSLLGFIFHGETVPLVPATLLATPPPARPPSLPLFFFLPGRKLHQHQSSCPSHLTVGAGVGGEHCLGSL